MKRIIPELTPECECTAIRRMARELRTDLNLARRYQRPISAIAGKEYEYTVFYGEYDIFDNLEVVGKDYIWQMYRDSPPLIWRTAFLNERLFRVANGFYSALDEKIHFYVPLDDSRLTSMSLSNIPTSGCLMDGDMDTFKPLHIAFDANASICSCSIGQVKDNTLKTIRSMFVKTPNKLQDLCRKVTNHYKLKMKHEIVVYYDHTFVWTSGSSSESYIDTIVRTFKEEGWSVTPVYIGQAPRHDVKHLQIDLALKGDTGYLFPIFNLHANEYLKLAMEQTGVRQGKNGFEKDKSAEALPDTPDHPDEYKTHITDSWDTLFTGVNFFYTEPSLSAPFIGFV